ncbi:MAG: ATP-binding protein [Planctomycetes bacterium]|nr:ATP-binding protein [Planctomycetota bacterium]
MYTRALDPPGDSFFLFGPRGTGKSTWLRQRLPDAHWFDLLRMPLVLELTRRPETFREQVLARPKGSWVVVDEVQRMPALLDEVHALIAEHGKRHRFAMSGSSARKLRRLDVNLLAGRALTRRFFPLTAAELDYDFALDELLAQGCLPRVRSEPALAVDLLEAYVGTYLREEIQQEALTKDTAAFARFLEVAALCNGQVVNVAGVARDAGVARPTVTRFFEVLVDTLIGTWLPAWRPRARIKEVQHPKFYVFDTGVVRGLSGRLREPLESAERGHLFETLVFHELRAAVNQQNLGGEFSYWRTPSGSELDFVWERGKKRVGIEVKAGKQWRGEFGASLAALLAEKQVGKAFAVYGGKERLVDRGVLVLPFVEFARELQAGRVLG